jgi:hypothetical protein
VDKGGFTASRYTVKKVPTPEWDSSLGVPFFRTQEVFAISEKHIFDAWL